jgi:hypothetical protein
MVGARPNLQPSQLRRSGSGTLALAREGDAATSTVDWELTFCFLLAISRRRNGKSNP